MTRDELEQRARELATRLRPLRDNVLVLLRPRPRREGRVLLHQTGFERQLWAEVLRVGRGDVVRGVRRPMRCAPGDKVRLASLRRPFLFDARDEGALLLVPDHYVHGVWEGEGWPDPRGMDVETRSSALRGSAS